MALREPISQKFGSERVKANMNSDIQLETAAIFSLPTLYLKHGIGKVYVMVDFICMGLLEPQGV